MGRHYAKTNTFDEKTVRQFAGPEHLPQEQLRMFRLFGRHVQWVFVGRIAKKLGCRDRLDAQPYQEWVK